MITFKCIEGNNRESGGQQKQEKEFTTDTDSEWRCSSHGSALCVDHSYQAQRRLLITEVCCCVRACECMCVWLRVCVCVCLCDLSDCTTKSLNGFSQSSNADAAAFREVYDVKHQRKGNNDHIHEMSFSSTFI